MTFLRRPFTGPHAYRQECLIKTDTTLPDSDARHTVRFYDDERLLLAEVAGFIDSAVTRDGSGIVIATPGHAATLRASLGNGAARVRFLDAADTLAQLLVDGWPDETRFRAVLGPVLAQAAGEGGPVHAFGEMVALLCMDGRYDAAVRLEELWNLVAADYRFALFCAYPWQLFPDEAQARAFEQVCAQHHCAHGHLADGRDHDVKGRPLDRVLLEQKAAALEAEVARRQEAERELRRRERELADFVENAAEGLHRVGPDGTILWANRAELQMLGYRWEEYVGRHIAEFHVDADVIDDILKTLLSGGTLYDRPARLRCKDGSIRHVLIHSNGCFEDDQSGGQLRYTRCFTRDASARHERDSALAQRDAMLLNAPVAAALLMGPELRFHLVNRRYAELAGRADLVGRRFADCFPQLRGVEEALEQVFETGVAYSEEELRVELPDAQGRPCERYFKFSLEALEDAHGAREGVIAVAVEMTEHVHNRQAIERAQRERERMLAELTAASQAKDEFLAMLGHELRNPLSPIVTALELMRLRDGDRQLGHVRERDIIQRQVDHLVRLVDDLLDVSRVTRGKIELKFERVELAQVLGKAVEMASLLIEQRHHRLEVGIEAGLEWEGDPVRLAQVVSNLLTNAARYTEPGGQVRLRAGRDGADAVVISVADTGIGLAPEMRTQVFDLFFQGKRSVDRAEGGLGIGLALVKNIVELHGGTVEARSEGRGQGSEFVVRLPLRSAAPALPLETPPATPAALPAVARRVLIVDDNVDGAETLGSLLAALGHTVEVYHEPVAALAAVARLRPEVALLDIGLPVLDGYQLAARIRALPGGGGCRLVALTGYGQEADKVRSQASGFERHLVKPISPGDAARSVAGD